MTTTGINQTAVAGNTYTATIDYANVSGSNSNVNPSANIEFSILANGVVVSSTSMTGLAQGSPWTPVTVGWVADAAHAGDSIQIQVVATNFLEGPGSTQQWEVPTFALANAALTKTEPAGNPPTAPSGLTATATSANEINLSWTDNANDESGFQIDRSTNSTFSQNLTSVTTSGTTTSYSDTTVAPNTTYYYRVWATNGGLSTNPSNTANATTSSLTAFPSPTFPLRIRHRQVAATAITVSPTGPSAILPPTYTAGVQNNTGASYVSSVPDGAQFAFINADSNNSSYDSSRYLDLGRAGNGIRRTGLYVDGCRR